MIDKEQFLGGMALLSGAYGREIDGAVQRMYYGILSPKLSTAEFEQAIIATTSSETFWPSPAVILSKVPRLLEDRPAIAFSHVNRVMGAHGGHRFLSHEIFHAEFDAPTKAAISAIGGLAVIAGCTEERWASLAKKFAAAYRLAETPDPSAPRSLTAGERDPRVNRLVTAVSEQRDFRKAASGEK